MRETNPSKFRKAPIRLRPMRYVWRDGEFRDRDGKPMEVNSSAVCTPFIVSDIPAYRSPIDGRPITSRSERREDLIRNNCVPYEPSMSPTKGRLKNRAFCEKRGLEVAEEYR